MSRTKDIFKRGVGHTRGRENLAPQVNLAVDGQYGYQPDIDTYVSNTGYVPQNLIPLLVEAPRGFASLPDSEQLVATLKSLIETQSKNITGISRGLTVEAGERQIGGAGHMQRDPNNVTEEQITPTHAYDERYGAAISTFWSYFIRNLIADPTTKQPGIMTINPDAIDDQLADMYSFTTLYIEPDPLRRKVVHAWMVTNMFPLTSGVIESTRDLTTGQEVPELSIEFTGIPVQSRGVLDFAQARLDEINYINAGPHQRPAFVDQIQADIRAQNNGYRESIQRASETGVDSGQ